MYDNVTDSYMGIHWYVYIGGVPHHRTMSYPFVASVGYLNKWYLVLWGVLLNGMSFSAA